MAWLDASWTVTTGARAGKAADNAPGSDGALPSDEARRNEATQAECSRSRLVTSTTWAATPSSASSADAARASVITGPLAATVTDGTRRPPRRSSTRPG